MTIHAAARIFAPLDEPTPTANLLTVDGKQAQKPEKGRKGRELSYSDKRWLMLNTFVDRQQVRLSLLARAVWLTLYRHVDPDNEQVQRVTIDRISKETGRGKTQVGAALNELQSFVMVRQLSRGNRNKGASIYFLTAPHLWFGNPKVRTGSTNGIPTIESTATVGNPEHEQDSQPTEIRPTQRTEIRPPSIKEGAATERLSADRRKADEQHVANTGSARSPNE